MLKAFAALCALFVLGGCGTNSSSKASLPDVQLPTLSRGTGPSLASCPAKKCLTVYVAPWCGYCRAATPLILDTREYLKKNGIATRVIVGLDRLEPVQEYAKVFGQDTLIDTNDTLHLNGVPRFYVSDSAGKILKEVAGLPSGIKSAEDMAAQFGLP